LANDIVIAAGGTPPRVTAAAQFTSRVAQKYPNAIITLTGHSLGGTIAAEVAEMLDLDAVTFNPGTSPFKDGSDNAKIKNYHIEGDYISSNGKKGKSIMLPKESDDSLGNHSIEIFLKRYLKGKLPGKLLIL